jgi:hypothetical protein
MAHKLCETSWPVCYLEVKTTKADDHVIDVAMIKDPGDSTVIPYLFVVGRNADGSLWTKYKASYIIVNNSGVLSVGEFDKAVSSDGLPLVVVVAEGHHLKVKLAGLRDTDIWWNVFWQHVDTIASGDPQIPVRPEASS